jgi:hypothetical protein
MLIQLWIDNVPRYLSLLLGMDFLKKELHEYEIEMSFAYCNESSYCNGSMFNYECLMQKGWNNNTVVQDLRHRIMKILLKSQPLSRLLLTQNTQ